MLTLRRNTMSNFVLLFVQLKLQLSTVENKALMADTTINIFLVSINFALYVAGLFGMNLDNASDNRRTGFQYWFGGFSLVFVVSFVLIAVLFYAVMLWFMWTKVFPVIVKVKI